MKLHAKLLGACLFFSTLLSASNDPSSNSVHPTAADSVEVSVPVIEKPSGLSSESVADLENSLVITEFPDQFTLGINVQRDESDHGNVSSDTELLLPPVRSSSTSSTASSTSSTASSSGSETSSASSSDQEGALPSFPIHLYLDMDEKDQEEGKVRWLVYDRSGKILQTVEDPKSGRMAFLVPADIITHSMLYGGMQFADLIVEGVSPGFVGRNRLGAWLNFDQNPIRFVQRVYFGNEIAWSYTRYLAGGGEMLTLESDLDLDTGMFNLPAVHITMRPYLETRQILTRRTADLTASQGNDIEDLLSDPENLGSALHAEHTALESYTEQYASEVENINIIALIVMGGMMTGGESVSGSPSPDMVYEYVTTPTGI